MRQIRKSAARSDSVWCVNILRRFADSELKESLEESPIVLIEGARQVGKSTLAREIAEHRSAHYVTLDDGPTFWSRPLTKCWWSMRRRGCLI